MKHLLLLFSCAICLQSCIRWNDDDEIIAESNYEAITQSRDIFENSITLESSKPINTAGKIYVKDNYIFINEVKEGFHVFNNINPEEPEAISFISVPSATDLAIRDNIIYVHHFVDLVAIMI
ncbi:hypothetical protein [Mesonia aestuariivivens]|uniref:Uncharacterized protein n=1 Tax=Mesonia aestuariivivens TaxID=2796128 RepID=A0ABS6W0R6_9FLAO|nr:hypothetical protein [Mesonia aestuariivivens]MBW2961437.1 hypothetical protein [Mesonia aestuariivivens]